MLVVTVLVVTGCVEKTRVPDWFDEQTSISADMSLLDDYGAAYLWDELRVESDFDQGVGFSSTYSLNQAIQIADRRGVKFGTVDVRKYSNELRKFNLRLLDSRGNEIPLDLNALKEQYLDTGKLVFPRVQPGCRIFIKIVFSSNDPVETLDYIYNRKIPVFKSRFSFLHNFAFKYQSKTYALDTPATVVGSHFKSGFMIETENVAPLTDLNSLGLQFLIQKRNLSELARTHVQIKRFQTGSYTWQAKNWQEIANRYVHLYHSTSFFSTIDELKKTTEWITRHDSTDFDKADTILEYVQDNFTIEQEKKINSTVNIDEVWGSKSGHIIDISVLLTEMLHSAGLETRHYVTRATSNGGFDPEIPGWDQLHLPLVSVIAEGREFIAFPYLQMVRLGEYPYTLEGLYGLSLEEKKPMPLPPSVHSKAETSSTVELSLNSPNSAEHNWSYRFAGHFETIFRMLFKAASSYDLKKFGNNILDNYSGQHSLKNIDKDRIKRDLDIGIDMTFQNPNLSIDYEEKRIMSLKPFFRNFFTERMLTNNKKYENDLEVMHTEKVLITDFTSKSGKLTFFCEDVDNRMFTVKCTKEINQQAAAAGRILTLKKVKISAEEFNSMLPDIKKLNRIAESYVTFSK